MYSRRTLRRVDRVNRSEMRQHKHGAALGTGAPLSGVTFLFPGVGDHYPNMGRGLYESDFVFRDAIDRCALALEPLLSADIREVLYPGEWKPADVATRASGVDFRGMLGRSSTASNDVDAERLNRTSFAQAATFVTEYALAMMWQDRGVTPSAMIGHSLGEFVAATIAGVFTLDDALTVLAERSKLIERMPGGAMLALPISEHGAFPLLVDGVGIAAVNAPEMTVVSGPTDAIVALEARMAGLGVVSRRLPVGHAFHSSMLAQAAEQLTVLMQSIRRAPPSLPFISNVSGTWFDSDDLADPGYWGRQLCSAVRFADGICTVLGGNHGVLVELGPGAALGTFARQCASDGQTSELRVLPSLRHRFDAMSDQELIRRVAEQLPTSFVVEALPEKAMTEPELLIAEMFRELLGVRHVAAHDDFFRLGGHSLRAMQLVSRLRDAFDVVLPVRAVFETRTVAMLAVAVEQAIIRELRSAHTDAGTDRELM